jgi:hypothetical protein
VKKNKKETPQNDFHIITPIFYSKIHTYIKRFLSLQPLPKTHVSSSSTSPPKPY